MKKSLISVAVLAALSSTQVNAGGPKFNMEGTLDVTCVEMEGLGDSGGRRFFNARFKRRDERSLDFELKGVLEETDTGACEETDERLKDNSYDSDDEDSDDSIDDDDSDDDDLSEDADPS